MGPMCRPHAGRRRRADSVPEREVGC
jgi:hypothetical protein